MSAAEMREAHVDSVRFLYTNWRGETAIRRAVPICLEWRATEHHPEPQWIMRALDLDKNASRDFALRDCDFRAPLPDEEGRVEMREALEQAYTEGFRDGAYDSKDLPRSWKNSDTARFAASIPDEEGMVERVARAIAWEACGDLPTADDRKIARAAIRAINGGKP